MEEQRKNMNEANMRETFISETSPQEANVLETNRDEDSLEETNVQDTHREEDSLEETNVRETNREETSLEETNVLETNRGEASILNEEKLQKKDSRQPVDMKDSGTHYLPFLLIAAVIVIAYGNSFLNDFAFDDHIFILGNPEIRDFSSIPTFFSQDVDGLYRPLRQALYTFSFALWGENTFGYHLQSLLFHLANTFLLFLIAHSLTADSKKYKSAALIAALLFAVHPIHTERVTNMTAGFDQLGILLFLGAYYLFILFRKTSKMKFFITSLLLFPPALLASEETITLPIMMLLYDLFFFRKEAEKSMKQPWAAYLPFVIIAVSYVFLRFGVLDIGARAQGYTPHTTFLTMIAAFAKYIWLLIFPVGLTIQQGIYLKTLSFFEPTVLLSSAVLLLALGSAVFFWKRNSLISFSILWFFITLLPMANIIPIQVVIAERYLYLASFGFSMLAAMAFSRIAQAIPAARKTIALVIVSGIVIITFSFLTIQRNSDWRDDLTLWQSTVQASPRSSFAYDNLGFALERKGNIKAALRAFQKAIELDSQNYQAYTNLGVAYVKNNQSTPGIEALNRSLAINPAFWKTYNYLGLAYQQMNEPDKALAAYQDALRLNPLAYEARNNLGTLYGKYGRFELAEGEFKAALSLNPQFADARYNLALIQQAKKSTQNSSENP
ncbi:tetratricopeptide repeat protein [Candidatus Woesearchaeota archaeon]|nr:tetratricopeptide repeat protein [Candidatus Woesearchaeota archaeon]